MFCFDFNLILGSAIKCYFFVFLFESSAHSIMSSGFEVRALTIDRNRLKRIRTNEEEEIFTIQVSNTMCYEHETKSVNARQSDGFLMTASNFVICCRTSWSNVDSFPK